MTFKKMNLEDFIEKYDGKQVEVAGSANAKFQCVDLANQWIKEGLGLPIIEWTDAKDFPSRAGDNFDFIKNTPLGVPEKGDLIVWNSNVGNSHGHIGIFIEGDVNSFVSFDQNYTYYQRCAIEGHTYLYVSGWLRPKKGEFMGEQSPTKEAYDACMKDREGFWKRLINLEEEVDRFLKELKIELNE